MQGRGAKLRELVNKQTPLKIVGVINAYTSILAEKVGLEAIYLSGAGVANACFGLPDLGMTSLTDVANEVYKIASRSNLPLLVDADTGWGSVLNVEHTVATFINNGAAGMHLEDQQWPKRCGHRDNKSLISVKEMCEKVNCASVTRNKLDPDFVIIARTDALAVEGMDAAISRAKSYVDAGADMIFAEAVTELHQYESFVKELGDIPILANITEYGKTPLYTEEELKKVGVKIMLFPLSAFRAMNLAANNVYKEISLKGTQKDIIDTLQTRDNLYESLNYENFENRIK